MPISRKKRKTSVAKAESSVSMSLKLLVDTDAKRVLFAEAGKDFVDFLFCILPLPFATVINLIKNRQMAGSLSSLYRSVENLNESYMQSNKSKDALLKPVSPVTGSVPLLALDDAPAPDPPAAPAAKMFYKCNSCYYTPRVTDDPRTVCPNCHQKMATKVQYVKGPDPDPPIEKAGEEGFVKGVVTYMVMDDLEVTPSSTISSVAVLNKLGVKDVSLLQEKVVDFGIDEAVKLLDAFLVSKKVLTEVFLT